MEQRAGPGASVIRGPAFVPPRSLSTLRLNPRSHPACAAAYSGTEAWKCLYGEYRLPFVTTPFFLNSAQFDSFQMLYDLAAVPADPAHEAPPAPPPDVRYGWAKRR